MLKIFKSIFIGFFAVYFSLIGLLFMTVLLANLVLG